MKIGTVAIFACASLMLAPASSLSAQRDDKLAALSALASRVGHVLGAASACPSVARERIQGVADKISDVIKGGASSQQEISAIFEVFNKGSADGARAVALVQVDCLTSERQLSELENVSNSRVQLAIPAAATAQRSAFASPVLTSGVRGVAANEIRFGSSLPLTGPNKESGQKIKVGIETAFRTINEAGGINGRMLRLIPADDGYEPARTAETMKQLYERDQVFGFMGNYGTPTAMVAAPFALDRQALFYAGFSGAGVLRHDPPDRYVFNYRASYAEETEAVVRYLVKVRRLKPEQIAVFAQQDAYGDAGFAGVAKTMRALRGGDGGFILRVGYARNTVDVDPAVAQLKANKTPIKAVVMAASYRAAAKFIEKTTDAYPGLIYTNVSFVGSTSLRDELMMLGSKYAAGVIVTQVVPAVEGHSSLLLQYKNALAKFFPGEAPDYVSFEYFVAGKVLAEALKRAGPELDSERIVEAFESIRDLEVGLGTPISFSVADHQGSHRVWGTQINDSGHFEALELQ